MKYYSYFPGCSSSEGTAVGYGQSIQAISRSLGLGLAELEDWNCCGSTPYGSANELESVCVAARNLAGTHGRDQPSPHQRRFAAAGCS